MKRFFDAPHDKEKRRVGWEKKHDSGYFDIIRFFGPGKCNPSNIMIEYLPGIFTFRDPLLAEYSTEMEKRLRSDGRLYDGPTALMVAGFDPAANPPTMTVREVNYGDVAGSSYTLDFKHPHFEKAGGTLRNYYKNKYPSHKIEDNPLANCLGVCGYLLVREENRIFLLQVIRSGRVASLENTRGPSVAGGVDFVKGYRNLGEILDRALSEEIKEEVNLEPGEYKIIPLAFAREIFRGERPQLFAAIETSLTREEVTDRMINLKMKFRETDSFEFIPLHPDCTLDPTTLRTLNPEALMNYYLLEECLILTNQK
ncbi:MAG: NUDIX hydrolase [candidate division Zixibacteria bacterium]|nr:NUDIX hydrolase [candidate division Zixibacteria bacterium]